MKTFTQTFIGLFLLLISAAAFGRIEANTIHPHNTHYQKLNNKDNSFKQLKEIRKMLKTKKTRNFLGDFIGKFMWTLVVILIVAIGVKIVQYGLLNLLNPAVVGGLFIGIGLGIILLAVIGFFIIYPDLLWFT